MQLCTPVFGTQSLGELLPTPAQIIICLSHARFSSNAKVKLNNFWERWHCDITSTAGLLQGTNVDLRRWKAHEANVMMFPKLRKMLLFCFFHRIEEEGLPCWKSWIGDFLESRPRKLNTLNLKHTETSSNLQYHPSTSRITLPFLWLCDTWEFLRKLCHKIFHQLS